MRTQHKPNEFSIILQRFFSEYLIGQRDLSVQTVAAYRDTFRVLLRFLEGHLGKLPSAIAMADLDAENLLAFLAHLENKRGCTARTRNARLAAIRTFLHYASLQDPEALPVVQRALAIPMKRYERPLVGFLSREEVEAILNAPDPTTWSGRRDRVLWATMYNTGARVSEITALRVDDVTLGPVTSLNIRGKGRKQRKVPLWKSTGRLLRGWLNERHGSSEAPLFPNTHGNSLTRGGIEHRLKEAITIAADKCPSLLKHTISPHTLRHTTAMHLLQSGVDLSVIALWLGHESPESTHMYLDADLEMKERALSKLPMSNNHRQRFKPKDELLHFLDTL